MVVLVFFSITTVTAITMSSSTTSSAAGSSAQQNARALAEAGINGAESLLNYQNLNGGNPAAANLIGCNGVTGVNDQNGPSNCASPIAKVFCISVASPCTAGAAGTASVFGYFSSTNPGSYNGTAVAASTWLLMSTGYSASGQGGVATVTRTATATVKISPANGGAVASVWNHMFLTAPLVPNVCQTDFENGNNVIDMSLYVLGNLCFSGDHIVVKEVGQPVDFQVGGKLVINSGSSNSVGVSAAVPITSGVVVGGCINGSVGSAGSPCNAAFHYWVTTADTFNPQTAPSQTVTDIQAHYASFDPGPKHACQAGTTPAPLASTAFDNNTTYDNSAASFELTPAFSYSCISQSGAAVGQLTWDNVAKKLTINGSIFFDGSMTISQSLYYVGTGIIETSGTVKVNGTSTKICATSPCNTALNAWQGSSGNNSMLTLAPLAVSATALNFANDSQIFQGSVWTQPGSTMILTGGSVTVEGPMSVGSLKTPANVTNLMPMPVIKNMPTGAPVPPNTGVTIGAPTITG
jgi:hypothetical protein